MCHSDQDEYKPFKSLSGNFFVAQFLNFEVVILFCSQFSSLSYYRKLDFISLMCDICVLLV